MADETELTAAEAARAEVVTQTATEATQPAGAAETGVVELPAMTTVAPELAKVPEVAGKVDSNGKPADPTIIGPRGIDVPHSDTRVGVNPEPGTPGPATAEDYAHHAALVGPRGDNVPLDTRLDRKS